jgi:tRNA-uridine 2-sulfurtransferase
MRNPVAIALSGGIDSLVAAHLLKSDGHQVMGIHFISGFETDVSIAGQEGNAITRLGSRLKIPVSVIDCKKEFNHHVINYFASSYLSGRTPNPCMVCNSAIKFGVVLRQARKLGATHLATGHYARTYKASDGRVTILRGVDHLKDQSYFLARLTQEQLKRAYFPLGSMTKKEVRMLAAQNNLTPIKKEESQDICFIHDKNYGAFLAKHGGNNTRPGRIEDVDGNTIGEHKGLHLFTVGQRRGINCPGPEPYYVVRLDMMRNRLVVGTEKELFSSQCRVNDINWVDHAPILPVKLDVQIRYRSHPVEATLIPLDHNSARVRFATPQKAVTPGQGAVFSKSDQIIGAGWIAA